MKYRKKMSRGRSRNEFKRNANVSHYRNVPIGNSRGGIRL